jgi:cysteinyl-tRNA synthetase
MVGRKIRNKSYIVTIFVVILVIIVGLEWMKNQSNEDAQELSTIKIWAIQLQDANPRIIAASGFGLVVIDYSKDGLEEGRYSPEEIQKIKDNGVIPIAYLSIGEAEDYRFYWDEEWNTSTPEWVGKENPEWKGNYAVKYWDDNWKSILHNYLDKIIEQGFSGVYLDKIDEFEHWADPNNSEDEYLHDEEAAKRMINMILDIANYSRNRADGEFHIIPQNGERILEYDDGTLLNIISGWSGEDLFYDRTEKWSNEDMKWISENRISYLDMVLSKGKPVFSVGYVDDGSRYAGTNKERIDEYREKCLRKRYIPYAALSDRELDELNIIEVFSHECMHFA